MVGKLKRFLDSFWLKFSVLYFVHFLLFWKYFFVLIFLVMSPLIRISKIHWIITATSFAAEQKRDKRRFQLSLAPYFPLSGLMMQYPIKCRFQYLRRNEWKLLAQFWSFTEVQIRAIEEQWIGEKSYKEHAHRMLLIWLHGSLLAKQNPIKGTNSLTNNF